MNFVDSNGWWGVGLEEVLGGVLFGCGPSGNRGIGRVRWEEGE